MQDKIFRALLILSAVVIPVIGGGIVYSLTVDASGAFEHFGFWHFIFSDDWVTTAGKESYGALPFITGTLLTTILALLMCIPFSLPVALFTGEYFKGKKIATILGTVTDLLAGIPSIIYGLWGFYVLRNVFMHLNLSPQGSGILTAAFVLAIMIVPYAASLSAEFIKMVPADLKEGAYASYKGGSHPKGHLSHGWVGNILGIHPCHRTCVGRNDDRHYADRKHESDSRHATHYGQYDGQYHCQPVW